MDKMIEGVILTPLKQIINPKGDLYHAMKQSDNGYESFGEAYFSTIIKDEIKGWKKHSKMILNLVVPIGTIQFVIYDDRAKSSTYKQFFTIKLSQEDYQRLLDAQEKANIEEIDKYTKALENRVKLEAKTIAEKYICLPYTTDFAILFLPTEGLYAEILRIPYLCDLLIRE